MNSVIRKAYHPIPSSLVLLSTAKDPRPKAATKALMMWSDTPDPSLRSGGQGTIELQSNWRRIAEGKRLDILRNALLRIKRAADSKNMESAALFIPDKN
jgi:hypothetical protein